MASNDSGVEISNDSNDIALANPPIGLNQFLRDTFSEDLSIDAFASPQTLPQIDNNCNSPPSQHLPSDRHKLKLRTLIKRKELSYYNCSVLSLPRERKLRLAASTCNVELLINLLELGTNPNCSDEHKRSALHLAACRGYTDIVTQLLKYGANPNIVDSLGNTPLHLAVISASSNNFNLVVRILLKGGANVHLLDRTGKNALELAESKLRLMHSRYTNPTKEHIKIVEDMCVLITLILRYFCKEEEDINQLSALEERLKNVTTNDQVVSEVDCLLASVERLSINK